MSLVATNHTHNSIVCRKGTAVVQQEGGQKRGVAKYLVLNSVFKEKRATLYCTQLVHCNLTVQQPTPPHNIKSAICAK